MTNLEKPKLQDLLNARFSDAPVTNFAHPAADLLTSMLERGSCRNFAAKPVPNDILDLLCAAALASPTKSDLQQRDIVLLQSEDIKHQLFEMIPEQPWVAAAPTIAVFCGNNRRQRLLHEWHDIPFANDHLDAFLNSAADAAIALGAFVTAAESLGLGCCPISAVRNEARAVSSLLALPQHVFPFAGLALGFPLGKQTISKRLPMRSTIHIDQYSENDLREQVMVYNGEKANTQPYSRQRSVELFGSSEKYGWSEDKVRQYNLPERADFGEFIRAKGFALD